MRNNQPVSNRELDYHADQKIVSTTSVKGVIKDVNDDFVKISGFSKEELIGQAHNIIRHPSMPQAAFKELWDYSQAHKPWMGLVKNRCKNGDHYWVDAFVTPMYEKGQLVGYQSLRQKPSRERIDRAESLYQSLGRTSEGLSRQFGALPLHSKLFSAFSISMIIGFGLGMLSSAWIGILAGLTLNFLLAYRIAKPWVDFANSTKNIFDSAVARKAYTNRHDELGQVQLAIHFLQSQQETILYRAKEISHKVKDYSQAAYDSSECIANEVNNLYREVEMSAAATHEMSVAVDEVAGNAAETSQAADQSKASVNQGKITLQETLAAMEALVKAVDQSSAIIQTLSNDSGQIDSVVEVISGIADQTNLLALNAAIEAARAGEQGRGFAVVADEVRALAAKTQESTGQINELILSLQKSAKDAVDSITISHEKVAQSVANANTLEEQFNSILASINTITDMCLQTATATEEQSSVANEISKNIDKINGIGQNTLASVTDASTNNASLLAASQAMYDIVSQFTKKN